MTIKGLDPIQQSTIKTFIRLGEKLNQCSEAEKDELINKACNENAWFTVENIHKALEGLLNYLHTDKLISWSKKYRPVSPPKKVGIIMAGNIPMVGFHDLLCVLVSGHTAVIKLSSDDQVLMRWVIDFLCSQNPEINDRIVIADKLNDIDAVIATGSNNTARYFDYYFSKYPNLIRKNRNSCAVLDGSETTDELIALGNDIFSYFGLGCRNVSKLYVPVNYNFNAFFSCIEKFQPVINFHKYANNYDYHKSIMLVNLEPHLDNGFILLKESKKIASAVAVLHYEYYTDIEYLKSHLTQKQEEIQCIVGHKKTVPEAIAFGNSQSPELWDYADKVDTMKFLAAI